MKIIAELQKKSHLFVKMIDETFVLTLNSSWIPIDINKGFLRHNLIKEKERN